MKRLAVSAAIASILAISSQVTYANGISIRIQDTKIMKSAGFKIMSKEAGSDLIKDTEKEIGDAMRDLNDIGDNNGGGLTNGTDNNVSTVPVPAAALLFGSGLIGLVGVSKRRRS
ncbi:MAG: hypothetical protein V3U84_08950 [Thiotrichaceae bacterium]